MTIDALEWLDSVERNNLVSTSYMFGQDGLIDGPCATDYDPWLHAEALNLPVIVNDTMPTSRMIACYSAKRNAIFVRPNLHGAVERCAVAHEIVHFEYRDVGTTRSQEDRADRISAQRLIRPLRLQEISEETSDWGRMALELGVTERIMQVYLRHHG